jgi:hypothetical protein
MVPMNSRGFCSAALEGAGPRCCLGSGDGNVAGVLGAAVAGDWAVGSGGCVGRPPTCEDDKETIPTHTPSMTTAVLEPFMTFSIGLYKRASHLRRLLLSVSSTGRLRLRREAASDLAAKILYLVRQIAAGFLSTGWCEQHTDADSETHANQ